MTKRVAFVAKRHSGKSSLAGFLIERGYQRLGFADAVKDQHVANINDLRVLLSLPPDFTREKLEQEKELHRVDLQRIGNDHGRRFDDECWIKLFRQKLRRLDPDVSIVVDDLRYSNEANMLRGEDFLIVKITRDEQMRVASIKRSLYEQLAKDQGYLAQSDGLYYDDHLTSMSPTMWLLIRERVEEELEKTFNHESERQVDLIEADICVANTSLEALQLAARRIANG